jgi:hypothetical protein
MNVRNFVDYVVKQVTASHAVIHAAEDGRNHVAAVVAIRAR